MNVRLGVSDPSWEVVFSDKGSSLSLSYDGIPIDYFDEEGRLIGSYAGGRHYRRGLDNSLLCKHREPGGAQHVRGAVDGSEKRDIIGSAYSRAESVLKAVKDGNIGGLRSLDLNPVPYQAVERITERLELIISCTWDRLEADGQQFSKVFAPVGILPPDQYMALVVQLTSGCSYNRCTFCNFYPGRKFHVKNRDELREHVRRVIDFMGRSATLRRSLFISDGNALVIPQTDLIALIRVLEEFFTFPSPEQYQRERLENPTAMEGIYGFLDGFSTLKKSVDDYKRLASMHLRRVYIGVESGDNDLLKFLRKPGNAEGMVEAANTIKAGGVNVGIIIMVGVGGDRYQAQHIRATIETVNAMNLGDGDIVYLSDFVNHPGLTYETLAKEAGITDLVYDELVEQGRQMRAGFIWDDPVNPPKTAPYDIREFVY
jgi:radical SAM superfamily enzyme YgiQ (UPF0313 family)